VIPGLADSHVHLGSDSSQHVKRRLHRCRNRDTPARAHETLRGPG
jgi:hypothetical protein